ncbi:MAG: carboxylate--amine ligase, partial [Eggerthellaceae bacterium]|nr:carboxylate--amine ligase [Eggerthellaceae bacterium]
AISYSNTYKTFAEGHKIERMDLFHPWVRDFMKIYSTYVHKVDKPTVAICDYLEHGVVDEFKVFVECFKEIGVDCVICDVRDLRYDGEKLTNSYGKEINAIWRRCVTNNIIDNWDTSQDLINAVRDEKVALIGSFAGHIVHDKQVFEVLFKAETQQFLTEEEINFVEQTVPLTAFLDDSEVDIEQIRNSKDEWIIKPADHYGAHDVYAGCEQTKEHWNELIDKFMNNRAGYRFVVQRYVTPYKTLTLPPDPDIDEQPDSLVPFDPKYYNNLNGLYLYDGHFQGVFSRLGPLPTVSKNMQGVSAASLWVDLDR